MHLGLLLPDSQDGIDLGLEYFCDMTTRGMVRDACDAPTLSATPRLVSHDESCESDLAPLSGTRVKANLLHDLLVTRQKEALVRARANAALELTSGSATAVDAANFLTSSSCLNEARASAVAEYEERRRQDISRRNERQLNQLAGELAKLLDTAFFAFGGLKNGSPELLGPAQELLDRSLRHLRERIDQALYGVRTQQMPPFARPAS